MTKTWLITGSSRGFGWELARSALDHGDHVVATARRSQQLDGLRQEYGGKVRTVSLDVTGPDAARAAVQTAVDQFGTLDVVVNNAGYANSAPIEEMDDGDFRAQIETNLFGGRVQRHQSCPPGATQATLWPLPPVLLHRRPRGRKPGAERVPGRQVRRGGIFGGLKR